MTQHYGFLWISGKPGAGKSTMMKFAYLNMKQKQHALTASFFFNARGDLLEKSISGMYRSLLLQLLRGYPDLQTVLDDPDLVSQDQSSCPCLNVLKDLFCNAVCSLGKRSFTCYVDALDECDEQQVIEMVQYFEDLAEQSTAKGVPFRICFSSRHYPYIVIERGIRLTLEDQLGHAKDLESYVISRLRIENAAVSEEVRSQLLEKAAGVFMWVVLVVDILNKEYRNGGMSMKKRLEEIPSDLSGLFKDILQRDNENMEALRLCILWILYAKRPLQLTELYHALWSGLSIESLVDDQIPDVTSDNLDRYKRYIISSSKGLAETTKSEQPTVQFIHESVRDFLIKDNGLRDIWPELGLECSSPSHEKLKQCCLLYMNHHLVMDHALLHDALTTPPLKERSNKESEIIKEYPFLKYASQHLLYHANAAAKLVPQDVFLSLFPTQKWVKLNNLFEKFKIREYSAKADLLYILADKGFPELIRTRLKGVSEIHIQGERYNYPFFAALAGGIKDSVAALFNLPSTIYNGFDITEGLSDNRSGLTGYKNQTPLSWAARNGRTSFVELLLQTTNIDERDEKGRTAVSKAAESGHEAVVRLLIEKGATFEPDDQYQNTPLHLALSNGHETVALLLIEKGEDINAKSAIGITPLYEASGRGLEALARLLIKKGADVNAGDNGGWTPLHQASNKGHEALARLLIEKGADVKGRARGGLTPLHLASMTGYEALARLLIERRADVNAGDNGGWTPLHQASNKGHEALARLLIERGADVNARDIARSTPLHLASDEGHEALARLLIEKGAAVNGTDVYESTPLHWARYFGHKAVEMLLVDKGAVDFGPFPLTCSNSVNVT